MTTSQMNNSNSKQLCGQTARRITFARHALQLLFGLALLAGASNTKLFAQYNGSFIDIQPVLGVEHPSAWDYISDISDDGLTIGMTSTRSGGRNPSSWDLYQSTRNSVDEPFGTPVNLRALSRSGVDDGNPTFSSDGLTSYYHSAAPAEVSSKIGLWTATRETLDSDWGEPQFLDGSVGAAHPSLSDDDLTLYFSFSEARSGGRDRTLFKMERASPSEPFGDAQPVSELDRSNKAELSPRVASDELAMVYTSFNDDSQRSDWKIMIATRPTKDDPFGEPVGLDDFGLGSEINSSVGSSWHPVVSADWPADGSKLYYTGFNSLHGDWDIYEATWNVEQIGDYSGDGSLDVTDLNRLTSEIRSGSTHRQYDLDESGTVDLADRDYWVTDLRSTWIGDANLDGEFNSTDFVEVFQASKYETGEVAGWHEGDWNGDERFDSTDFIAAFQDGGYETGTRMAVASVPEPSSFVLLILGLLSVGRIRTR